MRLDAMTHDSASAMIAGRRERIYRTFKTVERVLRSAQRDFKRLSEEVNRLDAEQDVVARINVCDNRIRFQKIGSHRHWIAERIPERHVDVEG